MIPANLVCQKARKHAIGLFLAFVLSCLDECSRFRSLDELHVFVSALRHESTVTIARSHESTIAVLQLHECTLGRLDEKTKPCFLPCTAARRHDRSRIGHLLFVQARKHTSTRGISLPFKVRNAGMAAPAALTPHGRQSKTKNKSEQGGCACRQAPAPTAPHNGNGCQEIGQSDRRRLPPDPEIRARD